jgi:MFS family permease
MNFQMTSALMATQVFGKGAGEYGLLASALAVGSLSGALLAAGRSRIPLRLIVGAALAFGVAEIVAGSLPSYPVFALWCPVIGLSTITMLNSANATMQLESDPAVRGRVMALYFTVLAGGTPIGSPVIGWIGAHFGARWCLIVGGVLVIVGVGLAFVVRRYAEARVARLSEPLSEPLPERVAETVSGRVPSPVPSAVPAGSGDLEVDLAAD